MADMRRSTPEPEPGGPEFITQPGMAQDVLAELAPLLAEQGIDLSGGQVADMETLQKALNQAMERRNMQLFTPVGPARAIAIDTLRDAVIAVVRYDSIGAAQVIDRVVPESPDNSEPEASSCIGVALGLLDDWLGPRSSHAPQGLADRVTLPAGHWEGERAAVDILALARKARSFSSLNTVLAKQGGFHTLQGAVLVMAAAVAAWAHLERAHPATVVASAIR